MQVVALCPANALRRWHAAAVTGAGGLVGVTLHPALVAAEPDPAALGLTLRLEALIHRVRSGAAVEFMDARELGPPVPPETAADLILDLAGVAPPGDTPCLSITCGGRRVELGAADAVLSGEPPVLEAEIRVGGTVRRIARWVIAAENAGVLAHALGNVLGRAVQLARVAVAAFAAGTPADRLDLGLAPESPVRLRPGRRSPPVYAARSLVQKLRNRLGRLTGEAPRWQVGWRPWVTETGMPALSVAPFRRIEDGGTRFFADPFPWSREGRRAILMEELPYATGKGVISAVEIDADGRLSSPRVVIEQDCHLSYPFLVEDDGVLYMIPETSNRLTVELWRCTRFPDLWEPEAVLISGLDLADVTVFRSTDGWTMLAASRDPWCSSWDGLDVWTAPALGGPWSRAGDRPVVVDVRSSRPAGAVFEVGGRRIRPVQDCSAGYGAGLAFVAFEGEGAAYAQKVVARFRPARPWSGLHTWNRAGGIEVVDVHGPQAGDDIVLRPAGVTTSPD